MQEMTLETLRQHVEVDKAMVVDSRATGGEVVTVPVLNPIQGLQAMAALAENLAWFMERVTGRGYRKTEEVYEIGYVVREPGHAAYGLKVALDGTTGIISRVAILEDETVFGRYVKYLQTGIAL